VLRQGEVEPRVGEAGRVAGLLVERDGAAKRRLGGDGVVEVAVDDAGVDEQRGALARVDRGAFGEQLAVEAHGLPVGSHLLQHDALVDARGPQLRRGPRLAGRGRGERRGLAIQLHGLAVTAGGEGAGAEVAEHDGFGLAVAEAAVDRERLPVERLGLGRAAQSRQHERQVVRRLRDGHVVAQGTALGQCRHAVGEGIPWRAEVVGQDAGVVARGGPLLGRSRRSRHGAEGGQGLLEAPFGVQRDGVVEGLAAGRCRRHAGGDRHGGRGAPEPPASDRHVPCSRVARWLSHSGERRPDRRHPTPAGPVKEIP
jgi:hypothetical protein